MACRCYLPLPLNSFPFLQNVGNSSWWDRIFSGHLERSTRKIKTREQTHFPRRVRHVVWALQKTQTKYVFG